MMSPHRKGRIAALNYALTGATVESVVGGISPDDELCVCALRIKTLNGDVLYLTPTHGADAGFMIFRGDDLDLKAAAKSVFDWIKKGGDAE